VSIGQWILRVAAVSVILGGAILLTPPFTVNPACDTQEVIDCVGSSYEIPDIIWQPLVALVNLNEYLPFATIAVLVVTTLAIRLAFFTWWLASWVWGKVQP